MAFYKNRADNHGGLIYMGDYHPWGRHRESGGNSSNYPKYSGRILDFKGEDQAAIRFFAAKVDALIASGFTMCAVPSHDPGKGGGGVAKLIGLLAGNGRVDGKGCLVRHTKIAKLAAGGDRSKHVHLNSIRVARTGLIARQPVLLIDDVMTTGGSMEACEELLMQAGAARVSQLVLARTV